MTKCFFQFRRKFVFQGIWISVSCAQFFLSSRCFNPPVISICPPDDDCCLCLLLVFILDRNIVKKLQWHGNGVEELL